MVTWNLDYSNVINWVEVKTPNITGKNAVAWLVSNCAVVSSNRNEYILELQKHIEGVWLLTISSEKLYFAPNIP